MANTTAEEIIVLKKRQEALNSLSFWQKFLLFFWGIVYAREGSRPGWTGKIPFYFFYCPFCGGLQYDYLHGYIENQYLKCDSCGEKIDRSPWWLPLAELLTIIRFAIKP